MFTQIQTTQHEVGTEEIDMYAGGAIRQPKVVTLGERLARIVKDKHAPQEARDNAAAQLIEMWGPKEAVHASPDVTMYNLEVVAEHGSEPYKKQAADLISKWMH